jgi:hypothetical protein
MRTFRRPECAYRTARSPARTTRARSTSALGAAPRNTRGHRTAVLSASPSVPNSGTAPKSGDPSLGRRGPRAYYPERIRPTRGRATATPAGQPLAFECRRRSWDRPITPLTGRQVTLARPDPPASWDEAVEAKARHNVSAYFRSPAWTCARRSAPRRAPQSRRSGAVDWEQGTARGVGVCVLSLTRLTELLE